MLNRCARLCDGDMRFHSAQALGFRRKANCMIGGSASSASIVSMKSSAICCDLRVRASVVLHCAIHLEISCRLEGLIDSKNFSSLFDSLNSRISSFGGAIVMRGEVSCWMRNFAVREWQEGGWGERG